MTSSPASGASDGIAWSRDGPKPLLQTRPANLNASCTVKERQLRTAMFGTL